MSMTENEQLAKEMIMENRNADMASGKTPDTSYKNQFIQKLNSLNAMHPPKPMSPLQTRDKPMQVADIRPVPKSTTPQKKEWDGTPYNGNDFQPDFNSLSGIKRSVMGAKDAQGRQTHKGMFSGIKDATQNFFNDPARVALTQAGLTAMDRNSYYDNQGFHSPWTGARRALGSGIKTYRDLSEPRKIGFEAQEQIKHKNKLAQIEAENQTGRYQGEFRRILGQIRTLELNDPNHPDIAFLKAKLDKMTRLDPSARMQNFDKVTAIRKGGNKQEMQDWESTGAKPTLLDSGDEKSLISNSGKIVYSKTQNLDPEKKVPYLKEVAEDQGQVKYAQQLTEGKPRHRFGLTQLMRKGQKMEYFVGKARNLVNDLSTGFMGSLSAGASKMGIPTDRSALDDHLQTIKANLGFDTLTQMKDASKTGGALGSITENEIALLQAVEGSLNPKNKKELLNNLSIIEKLYPIVLQENRQMYEDTYGEPFTPSSADFQPPPADPPPNGYSGLTKEKEERRKYLQLKFPDMANGANQ